MESCRPGWSPRSGRMWERFTEGLPLCVEVLLGSDGSLWTGRCSVVVSPGVVPRPSEPSIRRVGVASIKVGHRYRTVRSRRAAKKEDILPDQLSIIGMEGEDKVEVKVGAHLYRGDVVNKMPRNRLLCHEKSSHYARAITRELHEAHGLCDATSLRAGTGVVEAKQ